MDNGQQVVSELLLGGLICRVENHEFRTVFDEQPLDELEGESAQAVPAGHDNLSDQACLCSFQNGEQPGPLEVDPRADVADDLVVREAIRHVISLSRKIVSLFRARYPNIDDILLPTLGSSFRRLRQAVTPLVSCCPAVLNLSSSGPSPKSDRRYPEDSLGLLRPDIGGLLRHATGFGGPLLYKDAHFICWLYALFW